MSHSNIFDQEELNIEGDYVGSNDVSLTEEDLLNPEQDQQDQEIIEDFKNFSLTPKELMQMKLSAKKREEEENYTFQPKLKPSKWTKEQNERIPIGSRFDKLYTDALKRKKALETMTPVDADDLTFKPKISAPRSSSRDRGRSSSPSNIVERLYTAKGAGRAANVEAEKSSFQPTFVTKRSTSVERNQTTDTTDRMYMAAKESKEKQEKLKADAEARMLKECTFSPKISARPSSAARDRPPEDIAQRLQRYEEQKRHRIEEAKKALEEKEAALTTFKPALKTGKRSSTPTQEKNVYERLAASTEKDLKYVMDELDAELTFKPHIVSKRASSPVDKGPVHERLYKEAERRRVSMDQEVRHREDEIKGLHFKPTIEGSYQLNDEERKGKPVFERLASSVDRQQMQNILTQVKNDLEMEECTFKPQIVTDAKMKFKASGDAATPVHVRLNSEAEYLREQARIRIERKAAEDLKGATFKPSLPVASQAIAGQRRNSKGFMEPLHDKREVKDDSAAGAATAAAAASPAVTSAAKTASAAVRRSFSAAGSSGGAAGSGPTVGTSTTTPRSSNGDAAATGGDVSSSRRSKTPLAAPKVYPPSAAANGSNGASTPSSSSSSSSSSSKPAAVKARPSTPTATMASSRAAPKVVAAATPSSTPVADGPPPAGAKSLRGQRKSGAPDTLNAIAAAVMAESAAAADGNGSADSVVAAAAAAEVVGTGTEGASSTAATGAGTGVATEQNSSTKSGPAIVTASSSPTSAATSAVASKASSPTGSGKTSSPTVAGKTSSPTGAAATAPTEAAAEKVWTRVPSPPTAALTPTGRISAAEPAQATSKEKQPSAQSTVSDAIPLVAPPGRTSPALPIAEAAVAIAALPAPPARSPQLSHPVTQPQLPPPPPLSSPASSATSSAAAATSSVADGAAPVGKVLRGRKKATAGSDDTAPGGALSGPAISLLPSTTTASADGVTAAGGGGVGSAIASTAPSSSAFSKILSSSDSSGNLSAMLAPIEKAPVPVPVTAPVPLLSQYSSQPHSRPQTPTSSGRPQTPTSTRSHTPTLPMSSPVPDGERPPANKVLRGRKKSTTNSDPSATIADAAAEAAAAGGGATGEAGGVPASAAAREDEIESS